MEIIASNCDRLPVGTNCGIRKSYWKQNPETLFAMVKLFKNENIDFNSIKVEVLDEESSKTFLGAAGMGLAGSMVLGPLGLLAGALAGVDRKTAVFGLKFKLDEQEVKIIVKTSSKDEIQCLKSKSYDSLAS